MLCPFSAGFMFDIVRPENQDGIAQRLQLLHESDLESGLFIFPNGWGWVYIPCAAFHDYLLFGEDCGIVRLGETWQAP